ncbi:hypothetical protein ABW19_dt0203434 [Dactylella cylindrospora]|nr:hypothetical protein ABW19_dt0203434 [Dactylella cylindrospora]
MRDQPVPVFRDFSEGCSREASSDTLGSRKAFLLYISGSSRCECKNRYNPSIFVKEYNKPPGSSPGSPPAKFVDGYETTEGDTGSGELALKAPLVQNGISKSEPLASIEKEQPTSSQDLASDQRIQSNPARFLNSPRIQNISGVTSSELDVGDITHVNQYTEGVGRQLGSNLLAQITSNLKIHDVGFLSEAYKEGTSEKLNRKRVWRYLEAASTTYNKLQQGSLGRSEELKGFIEGLEGVDKILQTGYSSLEKILKNQTISELKDIYCYLHAAYAIYQAERPQAGDKTLTPTFCSDLEIFKELLPRRPTCGCKRGPRDIFDEIVDIMWKEVDCRLRRISGCRPDPNIINLGTKVIEPIQQNSPLRASIYASKQRVGPGDPQERQPGLRDELGPPFQDGSHAVKETAQFPVPESSTHPRIETRKYTAPPTPPDCGQLLCSAITQNILKFLSRMSYGETFILNTFRGASAAVSTEQSYNSSNDITLDSTYGTSFTIRFAGP